MEDETGLQTEEKEVVVSKKGSKSGTRQTKNAHESNRAKQARLEKPSSTKVGVFVVQGNLKRNGEFYGAGDKFASKMCPAIKQLLDADVIRKEGSKKQEEKKAEEEEAKQEKEEAKKAKKAKEAKEAREVEESAEPPSA